MHIALKATASALDDYRDELEASAARKILAALSAPEIASAIRKILIIDQVRSAIGTNAVINMNLGQRTILECASRRVQTSKIAEITKRLALSATSGYGGVVKAVGIGAGMALSLNDALSAVDDFCDGVQSDVLMVERNLPNFAKLLAEKMGSTTYNAQGQAREIQKFLEAENILKGKYELDFNRIANLSSGSSSSTYSSNNSSNNSSSSNFVPGISSNNSNNRNNNNSSIRTTQTSSSFNPFIMKDLSYVATSLGQGEQNQKDRNLRSLKQLSTHMQAAQATNYVEAENRLAKTLSNIVAGKVTSIIQSGIASPMLSLGAGIAVDKLTPIIEVGVAALENSATFSARYQTEKEERERNDPANGVAASGDQPKLSRSEGREIARKEQEENIAKKLLDKQIEKLNKNLAKYLKKVDASVEQKLIETADVIIEYNELYRKFKEDYPNAAYYGEKAAAYGLQAVSGVGLAKIALQEVSGEAINYVAGEYISEQFDKVINTGTELIRAKYPKLNDQQATALVSTTLLAGLIVKDNTQAFSNVSNLIKSKATHATSYLTPKLQAAGVGVGTINNNDAKIKVRGDTNSLYFETDSKGSSSIINKGQKGSNVNKAGDLISTTENTKNLPVINNQGNISNNTTTTNSSNTSTSTNITNNSIKGVQGFNKASNNPGDLSVGGNPGLHNKKEYSQSIAQHQKYKVELRANMEKPKVENADLNRIVNRLYRDEKNPIGSGSTAAALRNEIATDIPTKGKLHLKKTKDNINALEKWLTNNQSAAISDKAAAENMLLDLKEALNKRK